MTIRKHPEGVSPLSDRAVEYLAAIEKELFDPNQDGFIPERLEESLEQYSSTGRKFIDQSLGAIASTQNNYDSAQLQESADQVVNSLRDSLTIISTLKACDKAELSKIAAGLIADFHEKRTAKYNQLPSFKNQLESVRVNDLMLEFYDLKETYPEVVDQATFVLSELIRSDLAHINQIHPDNQTKPKPHPRHQLPVTPSLNEVHPEIIDVSHGLSDEEKAILAQLAEGAQDQATEHQAALGEFNGQAMDLSDAIIKLIGAKDGDERLALQQILNDTRESYEAAFQQLAEKIVEPFTPSDIDHETMALIGQPHTVDKTVSRENEQLITSKLTDTIYWDIVTRQRELTENFKGFGSLFKKPAEHKVAAKLAAALSQETAPPVVIATEVLSHYLQKDLNRVEEYLASVQGLKKQITELTAQNASLRQLIEAQGGRRSQIDTLRAVIAAQQDLIEVLVGRLNKLENRHNSRKA